jgi:transposase
VVVSREGLRVREVSNEEGNKLLRVVRRSSGSVVTWRRAQMVLLSVQGMDVAGIAKVTFTSPDRVREVLNNFNEDGFESLYPKYSGGRPPTFTLPQRQQVKKIALSRPVDHGLPFSTWSLAKLADFLVAEGVVEDISHEGLRELLHKEEVSFQAVKTWKQSDDPDYEAKKNRVLELYDIAEAKAAPGPGDPTVVFSVDEFGPLNLLPRPGKQWAPVVRRAAKGSTSAPRRRRLRATYHRTKGVRHLLAALDMNADKLYGHIKADKKRTTFLAFAVTCARCTRPRSASPS